MTQTRQIHPPGERRHRNSRLVADAVRDAAWTAFRQPPLLQTPVRQPAVHAARGPPPDMSDNKMNSVAAVEALPRPTTSWAKETCRFSPQNRSIAPRFSTANSSESAPAFNLQVWVLTTVVCMVLFAGFLVAVVTFLRNSDRL